MMGRITSWDFVSGIITADNGEELPTHLALCPFSRSIRPHVGQRVYFERVDADYEPAHAARVWLVLTGSKLPAAEPFCREVNANGL